MSRLLLQCGLCNRTQADGLLSRSYWGMLDAGNGAQLRACPTCKGAHPDWEDRLRQAFAVTVVAQAPTGAPATAG